MAIRSISGIISISKDVAQGTAQNGSVTIDFFPQAVNGNLPEGVRVTEMREAGANGPFNSAPTKNVSIRQFQHSDSYFPASLITGLSHRIGINDSDDADSATITWHTKNSTRMGEISYLYVGEVEDDNGEGGAGDPPSTPPFDPPEVVPDPVPGPIPLPGGDNSKS